MEPARGIDDIIAYHFETNNCNSLWVRMEAYKKNYVMIFEHFAASHLKFNMSLEREFWMYNSFQW